MELGAFLDPLGTATSCQGSHEARSTAFATLQQATATRILQSCTSVSQMSRCAKQPLARMQTIELSRKNEKMKVSRAQHRKNALSRHSVRVHSASAYALSPRAQVRHRRPEGVRVVRVAGRAHVAVVPERAVPGGESAADGCPAASRSPARHLRLRSVELCGTKPVSSGVVRRGWRNPTTPFRIMCSSRTVAL